MNQKRVLEAGRLTGEHSGWQTCRLTGGQVCEERADPGLPGMRKRLILSKPVMKGCRRCGQVAGHCIQGLTEGFHTWDET